MLTNGGTTDITDISMTDTLPISLTYVPGSLTATSDSYGQVSGIITWTGSVNAGEAVTITFEAMVSPTLSIGISITNSAVISDGREIITRTAVVEVGSFIYLPAVLKSSEPDVIGSNPTDLKQVDFEAGYSSKVVCLMRASLTSRSGRLVVASVPLR